MKKKILIFRSKVPVAQRSTAYRLEQGLQKINLDDFDEVYYSDVVVHLQNGEARAYRAKEDELFPMEADLAYLHGFSAPDVRQFLAKYFHDNGINFINSENLHNMPTSKLNQYHAFCVNDVSFPPTTSACPQHFAKAMTIAGYNYPVVVKGINSKRGFDNYLVKSQEDLERLAIDLDPLQQFVIQPFVPNDGDYRFIIFKDIVVACYKRSRSKDSSDHRNNVSQGGTRQMVENPPESATQTAIRAAAVLKRELTGIDIVMGPDNKPYVLESNFNFGLKDEGDGIYEHVLQQLAPILHNLATEGHIN